MERKCNECGGRIIEGDRGFFLCEKCGLCFTRVYKACKEKDPYGAYRDHEESTASKYVKEKKIMAKEVSNVLYNKPFVTVKVYREVHEKMSKYCKEHKCLIQDFVSELIEKGLEEGFEIEAYENEYIGGIL